MTISTLSQERISGSTTLPRRAAIIFWRQAVCKSTHPPPPAPAVHLFLHLTVAPILSVVVVVVVVIVVVAVFCSLSPLFYRQVKEPLTLLVNFLFSLILSFPNNFLQLV
jgi:hypothetical protein